MNVADLRLAAVSVLVALVLFCCVLAFVIRQTWRAGFDPDAL